MTEKKQVKIGVNEGGGPEPGYLWTVKVLTLAFDEAQKLFNDAEYEHLADQVRDLATELQPSHSELCDVEAVEDFYELKDKGGVLGSKNVRLFFGIDKRKINEAEIARDIVVLGVITKQNNGPTPQGDKLRMRRRWRKFLNGDYL